MTKHIIACVGSSLLTVALLSLMGFGPLNPPAGPITPTGVSLDQLSGMVSSITPGGATLPGRTLTGGAGTATLVFSDRTIQIPLTGYGLVTVGTSSSRVLSLAFEAGLYGGHLDSSLVTVTVQGSDGTNLGPMQCTRNQRNIVNGPAAGGNKAVDVLYLNVVPSTIPMSDGGGSGAF